MLYLDPSEIRDDSRLYLGDLPYQVVEKLEEWTGADMMISTLGAPASTLELIKLHLRHEALLVQRKHRLDLVSSIEIRLKESIQRMRATGARTHQCVLLVFGFLACDHNGDAVMDEQPTGRNFWSVYAGMDVWIKYGGVIAPALDRNTLFPEWVRMKERHIQECRDLPIKEVIVPPELMYTTAADDPAQELILVKDWRRAVLCCPGWGAKRVASLYTLMQVDGAPQTLLEAIRYMTTPELATRIAGVGSSLVVAACEWAGVKTKGSTDGKTKRRVAAPVSRANTRHRGTGHGKVNPVHDRTRRKS